MSVTVRGSGTAILAYFLPLYLQRVVEQFPQGVLTEVVTLQLVSRLLITDFFFPQINVKTSMGPPKKGSLATSSTKFISFSDVVTTEPSPSLDARAFVYLSPVYVGLDSELAAACKKLFKKDTTTLSKAITEINSILQKRGLEVFDDFLSHFIYAYQRIILINNRQIIELLNATLLLLVKINRPGFKPFMKEIIGYWWVSSHDVFSRAGSICEESFDFAFPIEKRTHTLTHFEASIFSTIRTFLALDQSTIEASNDSAEEALERIHIMALKSMNAFISTVFNPEGSAPSSSSSSSIEEIISSSAFWEQYIGSKFSSVRRCAYELLYSLCKRAHLLPRLPSESIHKMMPKLMNESAALLPSSLDTFIAYVLRHPQYWSKASEKKFFVSLRSLLEREPLSLFDSLLPLVHCLPHTSPTSSSLLGFLKEVFDACNEGSVSPAMLPLAAIRLLEVLCFLLLRKNDKASEGALPTDGEGEESFKRLLGLMVSFFSLLLTVLGDEESPFPIQYQQQFIKVMSKLHSATIAEHLMDNSQWELLLWTPLLVSILQKLNDSSEASFQLVNTLLPFIAESIHHLLISGNSEFKSHRCGLFCIISGLMSRGNDVLRSKETDASICLLWAFIISKLSTSLPFECSLLGFSSDACAAVLATSSSSSSWLETPLQNDQVSAKYFLRTLSALRSLKVANSAPFIASIANTIVRSQDLRRILRLFQSGLLDGINHEACSVSDRLKLALDDLLSGTSVHHKSDDDVPLMLSFLVHLFIHPICSSFRDEYILKFISLSQKNNSFKSLFQYLILSLSLFSLNNCHSDLTRLITSDTIVRMVSLAFFGRNRESDRSQFHAAAGMPLSTDTAVVLLSWNDIKTLLFPSLKASTQLLILEMMSAQIRQHLSDCAAGDAEEDGSGSDYDTEDATNGVGLVGRRMLPKKIARHICGLLSLTQLVSSSSIPLPSILLRLGLTDSSLLSSFTDADFESYVATVAYIKQLWQSDLKFLWATFYESGDLFSVVYSRLAEVPKSPARSSFGGDMKGHILQVLGELMSCWRETSPLSKSAFLLSIVEYYSFAHPEKPLQHLDDLLSVLLPSKTEECDRFCFPLLSPYSSVTVLALCRLSIDIPCVTDVLPRGARLWYLRTVASSSDSNATHTNGVSAVAAG